ncbi:hypothetical protein [Persicitalea sp.]|uniref:hypothetical protein n=1 Tax=Persicitalea sp. TaxID=3100273 RepID=UPI003593EFD1
MKNLLLFGLFITSSFLIGCISSRTVGGKSPSSSPKQLLLRDEGLSQLSYVDFEYLEKSWNVPIPAGRDLQLVGRGRVLVGTGNGYEERDIGTGQKVAELSTFKGTIAARRLRNGNTLLTGLNWQGKSGIVLLEVDGNGSVNKTIAYPGFEYVRLVRETDLGNFLITADDVVFEGRPDGSIIWQANLDTKRKSQHAWQAVRLAGGRTMVSGGFSANLQVFDESGSIVDTIGGPAEVRPYFFAGFQILKNGNIVVANWQGHGADMGAKGNQLLEYTPVGKLVWSWQQDPAKFSSVQGVIVLDGLDSDRPHTEGKDGSLEAF